MFAKTDRLMLRPAWSEDAELFAELTARESDQAVKSPDLLVFQRTARAPRLIGCIALNRTHDGAEFDLFIARPYWGLGFATEAGRAAVAMALESLRLGKLVAGHFADRPAAGKVLRKLGFVPAGGAQRARNGAPAAWIDYEIQARSEWALAA